MYDESLYNFISYKSIDMFREQCPRLQKDSYTFFIYVTLVYYSFILLSLKKGRLSYITLIRLCPNHVERRFYDYAIPKIMTKRYQSLIKHNNYDQLIITGNYLNVFLLYLLISGFTKSYLIN